MARIVILVQLLSWYSFPIIISNAYCVNIYYSVALAFALDITGKVSWSDICPGQILPQKLNSPSWIDNHCKDAASLGQAKVSLDDGVFSSGVTHDGRFIMYV